MKSCIGMCAVMQAHPDRGEIYARALRDLASNAITKRFVAGPFSKVIRKRSGNVPDLHGVVEGAAVCSSSRIARAALSLAPAPPSLPMIASKLEIIRSRAG